MWLWPSDQLVRRMDATIDRHIVVLVEKLVVDQFEDQVRLAAAGIGKVDVAVLVIAGKRLHPQRVAIDPAEPRNVVLAFAEREACTHVVFPPAALTTPDAHLGIQVVGLRIALRMPSARATESSRPADTPARCASFICRKAMLFESGDQK